MLHGCANLQLTKEGATGNLIAIGKELCVCVHYACRVPTFAGLIHLDAHVICSCDMLAVNQFRNAHVIFPLVSIWNGHQAFYLFWKASKRDATDLGPLVCTLRYASGVMHLALLPFVLFVVAVRKRIQHKFDTTQMHKPVPYVLNAVQNELKKCSGFVSYHHHMLF